MSNEDKVLLDLNVPLFQKKLFELDVSEVRKIFKTHFPPHFKIPCPPSRPWTALCHGWMEKILN